MPETLPEISVILPHLNDAPALARALAALAGQRDAPPFEVIVVDNGSRTVPEAEVATLPVARLLTEATPGPGPARSTGARAARAPLLAFLDADCVPDPDWVSAIIAHFAAHPETGVLGGDVRILLSDPTRPTAIEAYESVWGYRMKLYVDRDGYTATCNMAVRAEIFARIGDFAGIDRAEDVDWGRRATAEGIRIDYVPEMRIATPARPDFAALARKWDRHIGHDFAEVKTGRDRARWAVRALKLAVSPVAEIPLLARSDRLTGGGARLRAFGCLTRIRLRRAWRMLGLLISADQGRAAGAWRGS